MAPEQARGEPTSSASDRYALACVAFELLTGRRPFERESPAAEATAHAREEAPSARDLEPRLPAAVDTVFARGLAKRPEERYPTCAAFVADLLEALTPRPSTTTTVAAAPTVTVHHSTRYRSRPPGALLLAGVAGLLAAGAAVAWGLNGNSPKSSSSTVVLTRTVEGEQRTVVVTETTEGATVERTVTQDRVTEPAPVPVSDSGIALNDRGFRLLQAGDARRHFPSSNPRSRRCTAPRRSQRRTPRTTLPPRALRSAAATSSGCSTVRSRSRATGRKSTVSASRPRGAARTPPMETRNGR